MKKQYTPEEIKELRSIYTTLKPSNIPSDLELKEKQYQTELINFLDKNPSADEKRYIEYRIKVLEKVLEEYYETADMLDGGELDGKELINGNLITTKTGTASDYWSFMNELDFIKNIFQQLTQPKEIEKTAIKEKDFKEQKTFQIGLKFATGEAQSLYEKYKGDRGQFKKICLELGFEEKSRPYFSDTLPNNSKASKNLYNNKKLVVQIHDHCTENNIGMCDEFLSEYNQIEPE